MNLAVFQRPSDFVFDGFFATFVMRRALAIVNKWELGDISDFNGTFSHALTVNSNTFTTAGSQTGSKIYNLFGF